MTIWSVINEEFVALTGMGLFHASALALVAWLLSATLLRRCHPALAGLEEARIEYEVEGPG